MFRAAVPAIWRIGSTQPERRSPERDEKEATKKAKMRITKI
jgi:hypothetical protein